MGISVLIADDEPHARRYIKGLLDQEAEVGVVHQCKNGKQVVEFLKHQEPDLIFLDINMPGLSGVEVAKKIKATNSLIVFSTAYDEYALQAFELKAFDYLLKPFDRPRFKDVLQSAFDAIETKKQAQFGQKFERLFDEYKQTLSPHLSSITLKEKGFTTEIKIDEILYIEASSVYVILHLKGTSKLYRVSLNLLEQQLPYHFLRIHRSFIINTSHVASVRYLNNSTYQFEMPNGDKLTSSRRYKDAISGTYSDT